MDNQYLLYNMNLLFIISFIYFNDLYDDYFPS